MRPGGCELSGCARGWLAWDEEDAECFGTDSFAKTPLNAAQAPLVMAKKSHVDFVLERDMLTCVPESWAAC